MQTFLVILDFSSGMAEIQNVGIVHAESRTEAKQKAITSNGLSQSAKRFIKVVSTNFKDNEDWWYFE